ncbi:MAG: hypothetical protein L6R35_001112 [Caloplaca aegaea]|nr:MAG: hypothetical protein L6R35_001112 [Caloplaca aegaea]
MGNASSSHKVSAQDRAILDMKNQRDKLHQYQKRVTLVTDRETEIARECLARGDRSKALLALRRKKFQESLLAKTDAQLETLEQLTSNVEFALVQKDVLYGLQQGTAVLKQIHAEMGGIEHVEKLMGESEDAQMYQRGISEMLAGNMSNQDEDEVEDELEDLEEQVQGVKQSDMFSYPTAPDTALEAKLGSDARRKIRAKERAKGQAHDLMSHYINAFLIEPVVRQARRFSRPSDEDISPHPVPRQLSPETLLQVRPRLGPDRAWRSNRWPSTLERGVSHGSITPSPIDEALALALEGRSRDDAVERASMSDQRHVTPLRLLETLPAEDSTRSVASENYSSEDRTSSNPMYGVPESLRSTTSSFSGSAPMAAASNTPPGQGSTRTRGQAPQGTETHDAQASEGRLPADDGMSLMRKRIVAIQRTNSSSAEKARMVHDLMTEPYNSSQPSLLHNFGPRSPASLASHERPFTPASLHSTENRSAHCTSPPTSLSSAAESNNPFHLTPADLKPTFYQKPTPTHADAESGNRFYEGLSDESGEESKPLGCPHYRRNIKLQCSACSRWHTCRFCHDEVEDHSLNRRETKSMLCIRETHRCIERSTDCDCPICGEYMFTSPQTVVFMGCGHSIHHRCYYEHMKRSYRCPICSRSIVNMEMQFRQLEHAIESQPMPTEFRDTKASVYCNDCNAKSSVKYHWLGLKCGVSYRRNFTNEVPPSPRSRGRMSVIPAQMQRTSNSAPPSAGVPPAEGPFDALRRNSPPPEPDPTALYPLQGSRPILVDDYREATGIDSDEAYSDVDFWGLESPRQGVPTVVSSESGDDEDDDEDMTDDDADDQDEDDEEDQMEVFGHR